ncbi:MAG TPA: hypothetical protein VN408_42305, partial [Actinoplanes sp.]|nr:hypothetical protein [Actinoplanes sp.]
MTDGAPGTSTPPLGAGTGRSPTPAAGARTGRSPTPSADERTGRSPLQGGLPPAGTVTGGVVEIACDESGFSGTNLLRSTEPVITHASTDLRPDEASTLISELRTRFRLSPHELKSGRFLRHPGAGEAAVWFLARLSGRARVHLVDKEYFLSTRVIDLLLAQPSYLAGTHLMPGSRPA